MIPDDDTGATFDQAERPDISLPGALTALGISPKIFKEALDAEREFSEYLLSLALMDLYEAGELHSGRKVVVIARGYWPLPAGAR